MPHSYVAKPAAAGAVDQRPVGWNPIWPFPGVDPPGYAPSSPTSFNSDDEDEEVPPRYRVNFSITIDSANDNGGYNLDTILQMKTFFGTKQSPFEFFDLPEHNYAWVELFTPVGPPYIEFEAAGAGYSAGGVAGVSGFLDFDNIELGTSILLEMWVDAISGGFQVTLTADLFRTPWVELPGGGHELGEEFQIASFEKVYNNPTVGGINIFTPGWLNINRTKNGLVVWEQWAIEGIPVVQYLV